MISLPLFSLLCITVAAVIGGIFVLGFGIDSPTAVIVSATLFIILVAVGPTVTADQRDKLKAQASTFCGGHDYTFLEGEFQYIKNGQLYRCRDTP